MAQVLSLDADTFAPDAVAPAVDALRRGGVVGLPTDSVYVVASSDPGRLPAGLPRAVLLADRDELRRVAPGPLPPSAQRLLQRFWPGPLVLRLAGPGGAPVDVAYPNHRVALEVLRRAGLRVEAAFTPGTDGAGLAGFGVDVALDAGPTKQRQAPTRVRFEGARAVVEREGAIPRSMIDEVNVTTVLFVCTGNTCRSPMAEAMFRTMLAERLKVKESELPARGWKVLSAGTGAGHGGAASEEAEQAVKAYGADLSRHESQPVSVAMVEEADRVYVMTPRHRKVLTEWMPDHAAKIELLDPAGRSVEDPVGGSAEVYRASAKHLHEALQARLKEIAP